MPFAVGAKITGLEDLVARLKAKGDKVAKRTLIRAVREGARPVQAAAKANTPIRQHSTIPGYSGGLARKSIIVKTGRGKKSGSVYAVIGPGRAFKLTRPRGSPRGTRKTKVLFKAKRFTTRGGKTILIAPEYYFHLIERGVKAHAVGKGSLARKGIQAGRMHPGFAGRFPLQRGFESKLGEAKARIADVIRADLAG